jgi:hypothetical protein
MQNLLSLRTERRCLIRIKLCSEAEPVNQLLK